jgi:YkoY family integral membrane protein
MGVSLSLVALIGWYILVLVFLEGLLSADNALVLAVMVRHLPKGEQKRALRYGIWGAIGFRLIAVILSARLMSFWFFKLAGGFFLLYLSIRHFLSRQSEDHERPAHSRFGNGFWGTVVSVELADIAFSIDSILTAVAMVDGLPREFGGWKLAIVWMGGVLGIITMRFVAGYFIILLERFQGLEAGAYVLVAWIGLKLVGSGINNASGWPTIIPEWLFWAVMIAVVIASMLYKPPRELPEKKEDDSLVEVGKILSGEDATE